MRRLLPDWQSSDSGNITASRSANRSVTAYNELRHVGKLNTRVLWFFMKGRRIIAVHGVRNKGQAIAKSDLRTARDRMDDWKVREK